MEKYFRVKGPVTAHSPSQLKAVAIVQKKIDNDSVPFVNRLPVLTIRFRKIHIRVLRKKPVGSQENNSVQIRYIAVHQCRCQPRKLPSILEQ